MLGNAVLVRFFHVDHEDPMLPISALQSMNVLWATPSYVSAVSMHYVTSMFELTHESIRLGLKSSLNMYADSLVTRGRNEIVKYFLMHEEYTHLFWIDADISFKPQAAIRLLLADHDASIRSSASIGPPAACRPVPRATRSRRSTPITR
jgi:hypothetical protein